MGMEEEGRRGEAREGVNDCSLAQRMVYDIFSLNSP
jgi:hypothetical protein